MSAAPPGVVVLALALRIAAALRPDPTYYPDEIFQVLEQGHRLAFGYGFKPWKFDWGLRNWALPGAVGALLWFQDAIGLGAPDQYGAVVTGIAILLSLTLVASARRIAEALAGPAAGLIAGFVVAISPACIFSAQKITTEVASGYALAGALACSLASSRRSAMIAGILAGVAIGLRIHYAPALLVPFWMVVRAQGWRGAVLPSLAGAAVITLFGVLDWVTWGWPFASYVNLIQFNLGLGVADFFGRSGPIVYVWTLGAGALLALVALTRLRQAWPPLLCAAIVVLVHLGVGHKEARFIFAAHGLIAAAFAIAAVQRSMALPATLAFVVGVAGMPIAAEPEGIWRGAVSWDARQAFAVIRNDPDFEALALVGVKAALTPGYYGLHVDKPVLQLPDDAVMQKVPDGVTHLLTERDAADVEDFTVIAEYPTLEVRKRKIKIVGAQPPEASRLLLLRFDPRFGLYDINSPPPGLETSR